MKYSIDLRLLGDLKENDLIRFAENCWCLSGNSEMEAIITKEQSLDLIKEYSTCINGDKDIYDKRTRGGKELAKYENGYGQVLRTINIFETDYGTVKLKYE